MKTEDLQKLGLNQEQISAVFKLNGADVAAEQQKAAAQKTELEAANKTIKDLQAAAKKYDGVDVDGLKKQLTDAQAKYDTDVAKLRLDNAVDLALAKAHARNGKAVRALLDMDKVTLKDGSLSGLDDQLTALKASDGWAFDETQSQTGSTGGEHGAGGDTHTGGGVEAAFAALNPGMKL